MRNFVKSLDALNGGGWGTVHSLNLDVGHIVDMIVLESNADMQQGVARVEMFLNGDPIVSLSSQSLQLINAVHGHVTSVNRLVIPFADLAANSDEGEHLSSLVTTSMDQLTLKVRWLPAYPGAPTAPVVSGYFVGRGLFSSDSVRLFVPRLYEDVIQAGSSGRNPYKTFPRGARIRGMHLFSSAVDRLEIVREGVVKFDLTAVQNSDLINDSGYSSQNGVFSFLPTAPGRHNAMDWLSTNVNNFEIIPTVSAVGSIPVVFAVIEKDSRAVALA